MSFFAVPTLARKPWGMLALALNILPVAGVGSILAGLKGRHRATLGVGLVQAIVDVGGVVLVATDVASWPVPLVFLAWAWSIAWGIRIFLASRPQNPAPSHGGQKPATA